MKPIKLDILLNDKTQEAWKKIKNGAEGVNDAIDEIADDFKQRMKEQVSMIKELENKLNDLYKTIKKTGAGAEKDKLLGEYQELDKELQKQKSSLKALGGEFEQTASKEATLRTQIAQQKQLLSQLTEGTEEYTQAMYRLGDLQDRYGDITQQAKIHADDEKNYRAVADAVAGLSGAMSAGVGIASLFGAEEEKLAQIQTKLQAVMAVTIGLQQVAQTLNKDSYFQHILLVGIKKKWTAAQTVLNTQLGISVGLSKVLMVSGIGLLIAGIGTLISLYQSWRAEQEKQAAEQIRMQEALKGASSGVGTQIVSLRTLQTKWAELGNDLSKRKKFIEENKEAFDQLGVSVNNVADADNLFVRNTEAFINALTLRTKAMAAQKLAGEEYEKAFQKRIEAEDRRAQPVKEEDYPFIQVYRGTAGWGLEKDKHNLKAAEANREKAAKALEDDADKIDAIAERYMNSAKTLTEEQANLLKGANITLTEDAEKKKKAEEEARKAREQAEQRRQASEAVLAGERSAQEKIEAMRLAIMKEGIARRKAEARKELDDTLTRIEEEKNARLKALRAAQEKGVSITPGQLAAVETDANVMRNLAKKQYAVSIRSIEQEEQKELLSQYQSYTDKRLAIEEKYKTDMERIAAALRSAQQRGDEEAVAALSRARNQAVTERGKALMAHDFEVLRQSPEYVRAFEDLNNTSTQTLTYLVEQLEAYKGRAAAALNPEDLREYTRTIEQIHDTLADRNPFQALTQSLEELAKGRAKLTQMLALLERVKAGEKVLKGLHTDEDGKIVQTYYTEMDALKAVAEAQDEYVKSTNKVNKARRAVIAQVNELAQSIMAVGDAVGGEAGQVLQLLGNITQFVTQSIEGMKLVAQTGSQALTAVEKASVILTIIGTAIKLLQSLSSLFGDSHDAYLKMADKQKEINKATDAMHEYILAVREAENAEQNWFATSGLNSLRQARERNTDVLKSYYDKLNERQAKYVNQSGGGWLTNFAKKIYNSTYGKLYGKVDEYDPDLVRAQENLRIETRRRKKGFLGSGVGGRSQKTQDLQEWLNSQEQFGGQQLFDELGMINKELAKAILNNFGDKLVGETKETLERLIELKEKYEEYRAQLQEYVSSLYSPLVDNVTSALWDWLDKGKNALDGFKEYASGTFRDIVSDMVKTIVLEKVFGSFEKDIADFYGSYAAKDIDETQLIKRVSARIAELTQSYESQLPTLQSIMSMIEQSLAGADLHIAQSGSRQSGQAGVISTITQDQGTKLEGIMTSLQDHASSIDAKLDGIGKQMTASVGYLIQIAENTAYCRRLPQIEAYLEKINRDGIKVK